MQKPVVLALLGVLCAAGVTALILNRGAQGRPGLPIDSTLSAAAAGAAKSDAAAHDHEHDEEPRPQPSEAGPWPQAQVDELVFNFGRMQVGQAPGEHRFLIRNTGEAELILQAGKATCQCTKFSVEKTRLAPGEETFAVISWKVESRNAMFRHGGPVYTNDPQNTTLDFAVEGVVDVAVEFFPGSEWNVDNVYRGRPGKMEGIIASRIHENLEITSIRADSEHVRFEVLPLPTETLLKEKFLSGYRVVVEVSDQIPGGPFEDKVQIALSFSDQLFEVPLKARKLGAIRYLPTPGTLFDPELMLLKLGTFAAVQGRSAQIMLVVNQEGMEEPLQVVSSEQTPSFLKTRLEPTGAPAGATHRYLLTIEVPAGKPRVQHTLDNLASVRLKTNHPDGEIIDIDVLFSTN